MLPSVTEPCLGLALPSLPTSSSINSLASSRSDISTRPNNEVKFQCAPELVEGSHASSVSEGNLDDLDDGVVPQMRKWLLWFTDSNVEKEFTKYQADENIFMERFGQGLVAAAELVLILVMCASKSTRDSFVPFVLCASSIVLCGITVALSLTKFFLKYPWYMFLLITISTLTSAYVYKFVSVVTIIEC